MAKKDEKASAEKNEKADAAAPENGESKRKGRQPSKPQALVYKVNGVTHVMLAHPQRPTTKQAQAAEGVYTALGKLRDAGYDFGALGAEMPPWGAARLPQGAEPIGAADITAAPWA